MWYTYIVYHNDGYRMAPAIWRRSGSVTENVSLICCGINVTVMASCMAWRISNMCSNENRGRAGSCNVIGIVAGKCPCMRIMAPS